ncbi:charged multivesicular body protein 4c [Hydra vulgaris]|uniref:Charged multivesicular body protein 4c n=1 Tax=Hydra vulgaris TaxID=6087 RepID=A0ABM4DPT8_HYDVU
MSLAKIFGSTKKKEDEPTASEAIQRLRQAEELLTKKSEHLEKKIAEQLEIAKKAGTRNKRVALNALKKKKRLEKQLQQNDGALSTIEFQVEALESSNTNTEVLKSMGFAAKALKSAHQRLDVDDVHDLMDEISEQTRLANEISDVFSTSGFDQDIDEDELMGELEELEQELLEEQLLDVGPSKGVNLPNVPTTDLPKPTKSKSKQEDIDEDMAELAAWAS